MNKFWIGLVCFPSIFLSTLVKAQEEVALTVEGVTLKGTLTLPASKPTFPIAFLIAGSGPTDRNGNNPMMTNNSLKIVSDSLVRRGIATLRYDKRGVAASKSGQLKEEDMDFQGSVRDAEAWLQWIRKDSRFGKITIIGHSEGALVGLLACGYANQYVSLNGAGFPADQIILRQLSEQAPGLVEQAKPILDSLKRGYTVTQVPPLLQSLFRLSVQPYMMSWFKHDPALLLSQLIIPGLIVQGTNDIQVSMEDANRLVKYNPSLQKLVVEDMNHILKKAPKDRLSNIQTYSNPSLPVPTELIQPLAQFIKTGYWKR